MKSSVKLLSSTALAAAAMVMAVPTASADKHSSLEKRVKALEMGQTRLFVDYSYNEDVRATGDEATSWGFGVVQILEPLGAELYLGHANFALDVLNAADPDDVDRIAAGARFKF